MDTVKNKLHRFSRNLLRTFTYAFGFAPIALPLMLVVGGLTATLPFVQNKYFGKVIDGLVSATKAGGVEGIWSLVAIWGGLLLIIPFLRAIRAFLEKHYFLKLQEGFDLLVLKRRAEIDIADYEDKGFQDLLQRAFHRGYWPLSEMVAGGVVIIQSTVSVIVGAAIVLSFDWRLFAIVVVSSIPNFYVEVKHARRNWSIFAHHSTEQRHYQHARAHLMNRISVIETQLYQSAKWLLSYAGKILNKFTNDQLRLERPKLLQSIGAEFLATTGLVFALVLIIQEVISGQIGVGAMAFVIISLTQLDQSISGTLSGLARQYDGSNYVTDILEVIDREPALSRATNATKLDLKQAPEIVFEDVSFHYPHDPTLVLNKINLTIKPGEKLGVVGINGAGKTTLVKLLCRIYDPTSGQILVNGRNLKTVDLEEWRAALAVLFQDYTSFDFQADQAIAMGRATVPVSQEQVKHAAQVSGASSFIEEWPDGYQTTLGVEFGGKEVSKGQRQKLALARAIYRQGYVLILDEPTSSMDAESEIGIFEKLEALPGNVTALLVSHRFNTLRRANRVIVIKDGHISENGSHEELMATGGWYAEMFKKQVDSYSEPVHS